MSYLVLGGTGTIGEGILEALLTHCDGVKGSSVNISVVSRHGIEAQHADSGIQDIRGDAKDIDFILPVLENGWDVIIDLLIYTENEFKELVEKFLSNTKLYVSTSSMTVCVGGGGDLIEEDCIRILDTDKEIATSRDYRVEKARIENILMHSSKKNWIIVRPHITFGKRLPLCIYDKLIWVYRAKHGKSVILPKNMMDKETSLTFARDVGERIVQLTDHWECRGEIYNVASDDYTSWKDVYGIIENVMNSEKFPIKVKWVDTSDELISILPMVKNMTVYDRSMNRKSDNKKINSVLGEYQYTNWREKYAELLPKFLDEVDNMNIDSVVPYHALLDRYCNEYTSLQEFKSKKAKVIYLILRYVMSYEKYLHIKSKFNRFNGI